MNNSGPIYVDFSDFNTANMVNPTLEGKKWDVSSKKAGTAYQLLMEYNYLNDDNEVKRRLAIKTPRFTTYKGCQDHKEFIGKPAIKVRLDLKNSEHKEFVGEFGSKYEFDRKGNPVDNDRTPSTGCLSSLYDWSIENVGAHIAKLDGRDEADDSDFFEATKMISKDAFYYRRKYTKQDAAKGEGKFGELVPGADPIKFFKLMAYTGMDDTGKPLPTKYTNFVMASGKEVPHTFLYDKSFDFTGVLSFRRIYLGARNSVTMEFTHCIIHKFNETSSGLSRIASKLLTENKEHNPEEADMVEQQYAEMVGKQNLTPKKEVVGRDVDRFADDSESVVKKDDTNEVNNTITVDETEDADDDDDKPARRTRRRTRQTSDE